MNDCQISRWTGIPRTTVRDWRRRGAPGGSRLRRAAEVDCPRCGNQLLEDEAAYAYLLGLYLGDGCISEDPRTYRLRIFLDARYPGIIEDAKRAVSAMRPTKRTRISVVDRVGWLELVSYWQHWPCLFPQHGPGKKHLRPICLVQWQDDVVAGHPHMLLRGLIHSDGYRGINRVKGTGYPRYMFTNSSADIRRIFVEACDRFGVRCRQNRWNSISVARRPDVARLDEVIGPKV